MIEEQWKYIKGFEPNYSVSTLGRVRSEDRTLIRKNGMVCNYKGKVLKPVAQYPGSSKKRGKSKYCKVTLGRQPKRWLHRLVAEAFIPNPENKPQVNHIDGNGETFN